ncbi:MAG TPA: acyltransferase family protein [Puia sp.]|nr:acyltransferase family protein [Puia sp.]
MTHQTISPNRPAAQNRPPSPPPSRSGRTYWLDYLRGFITVLVVAHHSALAYTTFAHFNPQVYNASTHPIVDNVRSLSMDLFEDFNDVFFMSLMFLISGIFVLPSLARKGPRQFLRDRFRRLFIPFLIAVTFVTPIGYFASWRLAHGNSDIRAFLVDYITVEHWPPGPPWFIGILFIFNLIITRIFIRWRPTLDRWVATIAGVASGSRAGRPIGPLGLLIRAYVLTLILFLPLVLLFGSSAWIGIGPFAIQLSRILLYEGYFVVGVLIGAAGTDKGLLADNSALMRYTPLWVLLCLLAYALLKFAGVYIQGLEDHAGLAEIPARLLYRPIWTLSCVASCLAFLAVFHRIFTRTTSPRIWESLAANAYGIYLIHWVFVLWLQYLLIPVALPAVPKFFLTLTGSLSLSWVLTALIRRIPLVGKYL